MATKICPFCKERIKAGAIVCRYCHRELPTDSDSPVEGINPMWLLAGAIGLFLGGIATLGWALLKERRLWQEVVEDWKGDEL